MAWATKAVLQQLVTMVSALSGVQSVKTGVPESLSHVVSAYVTLAGQELLDKTTQLSEARPEYIVFFGHRVKGAEQGAEEKIADLVDAFKRAWLADRTLAGTCQSSKLDLSRANDPLYVAFAGQEVRLYPIGVIAVQQETF